MKLYFLRHGPAVERSEWGGDDADRPLTSEGTVRIEREAQFIVRGVLGIDSVISSPYRRALQTAEIVARSLGIPDQAIPDQRLEPGFDIDGLRALLAEFSDCDSVLLVGHEPDLSAVIAGVIGGGRIDLKKGSLACVALKNAAKIRGELLWLLPPAFIR